MAFDMLHSFFNFLGSTYEGELFKRTVEFVFLVLISYMIFIEYISEKKPELKYMIYAFMSLTLQKLIIGLIMFYEIFSKVKLEFLAFYTPIVDNFLETLAIIMLTNAFLFPFFKKRMVTLSNMIKSEILGLSIIGSIVGLIWFNHFTVFHAAFLFFDGRAVFVVSNLILLFIPVFYWAFRGHKGMNYRYEIITAFSIYLITFFIDAVNLFFYDSTNTRLFVAKQPFPFISILIFIHIVYLKLIDKATLRKKLHESEKKYLETKELSKMKDDFVSVVSHELRTPLTSMNLYISLLKDGELGEITPKQKEALETIKEENLRLTKLINDVLDLSKVESKTAKLHLEEFDLSKMLKDNMYYELAKKKGIEVKTEIPDLFIVKIDVPKFKQVVVNLLSNAIKFTEPRGKITVSLEQDHHHWILAIHDTGKGIPKEKLSKVFDRFYQVDDHMVRTQSGIGLGLAIAKNIIALHKGKIRAESIVGKGTSFVITMPYIK